MRSIYFVFILFVTLSNEIHQVFSNEVVSSSLTLEQCLELALRQNPQLEPYRWALRSFEGTIEQAGLRPNPELEVEAENVLGSKSYQWFDGSETTVSLSQTIETGRKRNHRIRVAETEKIREERGYEIARQDVLYETSVAFIDLLAAQERIGVFKNFLGVSEKMLETIKAMVAGGRDSPIEETRAELIVATVRIDWERSLRESERTKVLLAKQWGASGESIADVTGDLFAIHSVADLDELLAGVERHPLLRQARSEMTLRQAELGLESAKGVPDIRVGAGVRYLADSDDGAFVALFSMPLPIRDRNQGAVRAASNRLQQAGAQQTAVEIELRSELEAAYQELLQTQEVLLCLKTEILPRTNEAFQAIREGYQQGKFPYLNVLDSQRTTLETQRDTVEAAFTYQQAWNRLNQLTGHFVIERPPIKE